jgi:hypothetical protein
MARRSDRAGEHAPVGPELIAVSFPPAIPRRGAPQQSPLPLRRLAAYTDCYRSAQSRAGQPVPSFCCLSRGVHSTALHPF